MLLIKGELPLINGLWFNDLPMENRIIIYIRSPLVMDSCLYIVDNSINLSFIIRVNLSCMVNCN